MTGFQSIFARIEKKYLLDPEQYRSIVQILRLHGFRQMLYPDPTTCSMYYDTNDYVLARRSIDRPKYKEKLRLRIYGHQAENLSTSFPEIKKKWNGVVYKRRVALPYEEAIRAMETGNMPISTGQIGKEIAYFHELYSGIRPKLIIAYERETWQSPQGSDFRVTFDTSIRCRTDDLDLRHGSSGNLLLDPNLRMMELKLPMAFPRWLTDSLWGHEIHQVHFSKYGEAYLRFILTDSHTPAMSRKETCNVA